jgi:outer membrane protein
MKKIIRFGFLALLFGLSVQTAAFAQVIDSTKADTAGFGRMGNAGLLSDSTSQLVPTINDTTGRKITLQQSINIALKRNYQIKEGQNNLTLAQKQILGAKANFLPTLSGSLRGTQTIGQQFNQTTVSFNNVTSNNISGGLTANLTVFQGFSNIINLRRSHINKHFQKASNQRTRETVIFNAISGFLQVILNQQLVKIDRQNLKSAIEQLKQVKGEVEVGTQPKVDLFNQQSTVATDRVTLIQQENTLAYSKTLLISTLQLDPKKAYRFVAPDIADYTPAPTKLDLSQLIDQALADRPDLKAQKLQIELNRKSLGMQRANYYPTISANAAVNTRYNDQYKLPEPDPNNPGQFISSPVSFSDQFFHQDVNYFFGFSVNVPILNHLSTRLSVQQAKITYENSKQDYQNLRYTALQEVRQAYNDYQSYSAQLSSTKIALKAARKTYQQQKVRYNVGAGSLIEVSTANAAYVQAQANRVQDVLRFVFQKKLLNYYLGTINKHVSLF